MPGIWLVANGAVAVAAKEMLMDDATKAIDINIMDTTTILLLFHSAHVLRMKKLWEQMPNIMLKPEEMLTHVRHLPGLLYGTRHVYRFVVRSRNGIYRVRI